MFFFWKMTHLVENVIIKTNIASSEGPRWVGFKCFVLSDVDLGWHFLDLYWALDLSAIWSQDFKSKGTFGIGLRPDWVRFKKYGAGWVMAVIVYGSCWSNPLVCWVNLYNTTNYPTLQLILEDCWKDCWKAHNKAHKLHKTLFLAPTYFWPPLNFFF